MKKTFLILLFILLFASTSWCISISGGSYVGDSVGVVDILLKTTNALANSGEDTETIWVNSILSPTPVTFVVKNESVAYHATDTTGVFAFKFSTATAGTDYFIIKNATFWALYENLNNMSWGVFDSSLLPQKITGKDGVQGMNLPSDSFIISHVTRFDAPAPVPEPSTLLLLGGGLIGLAFYGRKRKQA